MLCLLLLSEMATIWIIRVYQVRTNALESIPECIMMGGDSIEGKNKNTSVSCWRSKQMCSRAEYAKHIHTGLSILA